MDRFALITGASGGIGRSIAKKLNALGYSLYVHYNKDIQSINDLIAELSDTKTMLHPIQADLSTRDGVQQLLDQIHCPIDTIILNSGKDYYGLVTEMSDETIEDLIQLHITSPFLITKALLPRMITNKKGNITVISSIWGLTGASYEVLYSTVKGGQNTFVKALAKELAPSGIRVNAVAPGAIMTAMLEDFHEEELNELKTIIPMGRIGYPEEVADAVAFLASDKASYITGQILSVNGGWYC